LKVKVRENPVDGGLIQGFFVEQLKYQVVEHVTIRD
jgi:hypothetical protein